MKTIYLATDSRGTVATTDRGSRDTSWTERIKKIYSANFICRRSALEIPDHHIYDFENLLTVPDQSIDLAILQTGMYSGIDYCSTGVFQRIFGTHYTPEGLMYHHPDLNRYIFSHKESTEQMFDILRQKCKRTVYIGLHSLNRWHLELRRGREWNPTYNQLAEVQNKWYGSMVTDYIPLPQDEKWVDQCTIENEFLHYSEPGVCYILDHLHPIVSEILS